MNLYENNYSLKKFFSKKKNNNTNSKVINLFFKNSNYDKFNYNRKLIVIYLFIFVLFLRIILIIIELKIFWYNNIYYNMLLIFNSIFALMSTYIYIIFIRMEQRSYFNYSILVINIIHSSILTKGIHFYFYDVIVDTYLKFYLNDLFNIINTYWVAIIFYYILYSSFYNNNRSIRISKILENNLNFKFLIKCYFKTYNFTFVILSMIIYLLMVGLVLHIIENKLISQEKFFGNIINCFWMIFITLNSVGFGDRSLKTLFGRVIGVFTSLSGLIFMSLIVISSTKWLTFEKNENISFIMIKNISNKHKHHNISSKIITIIFKLKKEFKANNLGNISKYLLILKKLLQKQKKIQNKYKINKDYYNLDEEINYTSRTVDEKLNDIIKKLK